MVLETQWFDIKLFRSRPSGEISSIRSGLVRIRGGNRKIEKRHPKLFQWFPFQKIGWDRVDLWRRQTRSLFCHHQSKVKKNCYFVHINFLRNKSPSTFLKLFLIFLHIENCSLKSWFDFWAKIASYRHSKLIECDKIHTVFQKDL